MMDQLFDGQRIYLERIIKDMKGASREHWDCDEILPCAWASKSGRVRGWLERGELRGDGIVHVTAIGDLEGHNPVLHVHFPTDGYVGNWRQCVAAARQYFRRQISSTGPAIKHVGEQ